MSSLTKIDSLRVSAIVHATEDSSKVTQSIRNVSQPNDPAQLAVSRAKGHYGNQIITLVSKVKNPRSVENCLRAIWNDLSLLDRDTIFSTLASRVDNSGTLFLRIDKQEAFKGKMRLQDSDPIKVEISFRLPRSKEDGAIGHILVFMTEISANVAASH